MPEGVMTMLFGLAPNYSAFLWGHLKLAALGSQKSSYARTLLVQQLFPSKLLFHIHNLSPTFLLVQKHSLNKVNPIKITASVLFTCTFIDGPDRKKQDRHYMNIHWQSIDRNWDWVLILFVFILIYSIIISCQHTAIEFTFGGSNLSGRLISFIIQML